MPAAAAAAAAGFNEKVCGRRSIPPYDD